MAVLGALLLVVAACDASGDPEPTTTAGSLTATVIPDRRSPLEGLWATESVETAIVDTEGWIDGRAGVSLADGELNGQIFGVNSYSGEYDFDGEVIAIGASHTLTACGCPIDEIESAFVYNFRVGFEGDNRMIWSSNDMVLTFGLIGLHPPDGNGGPSPEHLVVGEDRTLTTAHYGSIEIGADGVTLDCAGHQIVGPGEIGIAVDNRRNVVLENCAVTGFEIGIQLGNTTDTQVIGTTTSANNIGISLAQAHNNRLIGNTGTLNRYQHIAMSQSSNNVLEANSMFGASTGIAIQGGEGNTIAGNQIATSVDGITSRDSQSSTFTDNRVEMMFSRGTGFAMGGGQGNTVAGNTITAAAEGFSVVTGTGNTFENNTTVATKTGFSLERTTDNTFVGNAARDADIGLIGLMAGSGNSFVDNSELSLEPVLVVSENTTLEADHAGSVVIAADGVTLNCAGFEIFGRQPEDFRQTVFGAGIEIHGHRDVTIENCDVNGFEIGIGLWQAHQNTIRNNSIGDSLAGIWIMQSDDNTVSKNTLPGGQWHTRGSIVLSKSRRNTIENNEATWISLDRSHRTVVQGNRAGGLRLLRADDNTVLDNEVRNLSLDRADGNSIAANSGDIVYLSRSVDNDLERNTASQFTITGKSNENRLQQNVASDGRIGFTIRGGSNGNVLKGNRAVDTRVGFHLGKAANNTFEANETTGNRQALRVSKAAEDNGNVFVDNIGF